MLLIFDIDGTLCNTKAIGDNCFIETFETMYRCTLGNVEWETFTNVTDTGLFNDLFLQYKKTLPTNLDRIAFETLYKTNLINTFSKNTLYEVEGANQFMIFCKNQNIRIAIATGNWRSLAELKLTSCKIELQKTPISTSNDALHREEIISSVIQKSLKFYDKSRFDKVVYLGDGLWDYECAKKLNIHFIGVDIDENKKLKSTTTKLIISSFNDYENILQYIYNL